MVGENSVKNGIGFTVTARFRALERKIKGPQR
jgi:hypothetical protein